MTKAEKKAHKLIEHYKLVVYPYMGSDFMTGTENEELKLKSAIKESLFLVDYMLEVVYPFEFNNENVKKVRNEHILFWLDVKQVLENLK